jgi:hypothetical protein
MILRLVRLDESKDVICRDAGCSNALRYQILWTSCFVATFKSSAVLQSDSEPVVALMMI